MSKFRDYLIRTFQIESEPVVHFNCDIRLQHQREDEPFAEIITNERGTTILRVGGTESDAPIIKCR